MWYLLSIGLDWILLTPTAGATLAIIIWLPSHKLSCRILRSTGRLVVSTGSLHMANRALHLPGRILRGIGLDARRCRCIRSSAVAIRDGDGFASVGGVRRKAPARDVTVSFQNIFGGDL